MIKFFFLSEDSPSAKILGQHIIKLFLLTMQGSRAWNKIQIFIHASWAPASSVKKFDDMLAQIKAEGELSDKTKELDQLD